MYVRARTRVGGPVEGVGQPRKSDTSEVNLKDAEFNKPSFYRETANVLRTCPFQLEHTLKPKKGLERFCFTFQIVTMSASSLCVTDSLWHACQTVSESARHIPCTTVYRRYSTVFATDVRHES